MKKILLAAIIAITGVSFMSCSSDSNESKSEKQEQRYKDYLVGKWRVTGQRESGNVYNCLYRIEGDYFVEFKSDGSAICSGNAKAHAYYEGEPELTTENIGDFLNFTRWSLDYNDVSECHIWTYLTNSSTGESHKLEFSSDGSIRIWYHLIRDGYYTLSKVK